MQLFSGEPGSPLSNSLAPRGGPGPLMRTRVEEHWCPELQTPRKAWKPPLLWSRLRTPGAPSGCVPGPFPGPHTPAGAAWLRLLLLLEGLQQPPTLLPDTEQGCPGEHWPGRPGRAQRLTSGSHGTHSGGRYHPPLPAPPASPGDGAASSTSLFKKQGQTTPKWSGPLKATWELARCEPASLKGHGRAASDPQKSPGPEPPLTLHPALGLERGRGTPQKTPTLTPRPTGPSRPLALIVPHLLTAPFPGHPLLMALGHHHPHPGGLLEARGWAQIQQNKLARSVGGADRPQGRPPAPPLPTRSPL